MSRRLHVKLKRATLVTRLTAGELHAIVASAIAYDRWQQQQTLRRHLGAAATQVTGLFGTLQAAAFDGGNDEGGGGKPPVH
jgi:hypothetical protein